jgi:hypothetical protein
LPPSVDIRLGDTGVGLSMAFQQQVEVAKISVANTVIEAKTFTICGRQGKV